MRTKIWIGLFATVAAILLIVWFSWPRNRGPASIADDRPRVLVAKQNCFEGITISKSDVMVRPAEAAEIGDYRLHKDKFQLPDPETVHLKVFAQNVMANEPLLVKHFVDPAAQAETLPGPGMKIVELWLPRRRSTGKSIRKGDRVDVYLTIEVEPNQKEKKLVTGEIASRLKVLKRREPSYDKQADAENRSGFIGYLLEANVYRTALINYAKTRGEIELLFENSTEPPTFDNQDEELCERVLEGYAITDIDLTSIPKAQPRQQRKRGSL